MPPCPCTHGGAGGGRAAVPVSASGRGREWAAMHARALALAALVLLGASCGAEARMGVSRFKRNNPKLMNNVTRKIASQIREVPFDVEEHFCSDGQAASADVTWATGGTYGRVDFLEFSMSRWQGPVAVAWYVPAPRNHTVAEAHRLVIREWCDRACAGGDEGRTEGRGRMAGCTVDVSLLYATTLDVGMIPTNVPKLAALREELERDIESGAVKSAKADAYAAYEAAFAALTESEERHAHKHKDTKSDRAFYLNAAVDAGVAAVDTMYPINAVRNAALALVKTDFVLQADIDFVPSVDLHKTLVSPASEATREVLRKMKDGADSQTERIGLVIAPFEMSYRQYLDSWKSDPAVIPRSWPEIKAASKSFFRKGATDDVYPFHKGTRHEPTQFKKYIQKDPAEDSDPYQVKTSTRQAYEAWFVQPTKGAIRWDEKYRGGAKDLSDLHLTLHGCGYQLWVLPGEFIVHMPHPTSSAQAGGPVFLMNWWTNTQLYRNKTRRTRQEFDARVEISNKRQCKWV